MSGVRHTYLLGDAVAAEHVDGVLKNAWHLVKELVLPDFVREHIVRLSAFLLVVRHVVALHVREDARDEADRLNVLLPPLHVELQQSVALVRRAVLEEEEGTRDAASAPAISKATNVLLAELTL